MSNFRQVDRQTGFLLPPSVDEWLPQRHLARFVVEVIDGLDLRELGEITGGPAPLTKQDRSRFLSALDTAVQAASRAAVRS